MISVILLGFVIGMHHALDPDHVAAVGTIVSRERSIFRAVQAGVLWGLGHCLTIVVAGGTILAFRIAVPESVSIVGETSAMATPLGYARTRFGLNERRLALSCGIASICTGVFLGIQTLA